MLLVLVALASVAIQSCVAAGDPSAKDEVVSINPLTSVYIGVEDDFVFACSINMPDLTLTLIIDNSTNSPKMKRVKSEPFPNYSKGAIYTFHDVAPADNGTTFFCLAINDTFMSTSSVLNLHVVAVNITSLTGPGVEVEDDFMFACWVDQPDLQLSLIIDDTIDSPKMDRVVTENFPGNDTDSGRVYTFKNIEPDDNGTTFLCIASEGSQTFTSDVVTMEAIATPLFVAGSNQSRYNFTLLGVNGYLNCEIFYSNPPLLNLSLANNSKNTENVKFDEKASRVVFTGARVNNRGNYTCTATNALGSTYLTFETFIGGAPNNVSVDVMEETVNQSIVLSFSINDMSDAPAISVNIKLMGVTEMMLDFYNLGLHIPVTHIFHNAAKVDRGEVYAAYYPVVVTASNELGNRTAKSGMAFLNGTLPLEVTIEPSSSNVTKGSRYSFECKAHPKNMSNVSIPFTVLINGSSEGPLQKRLVKDSSNPLSQKFHFQNVSVADEGVSFACVGSGVYVSELTNLTVFSTPLFIVGSNQSRCNFILLGKDGTLNCKVSYSNPPLLSLSLVNDSKNTENVKFDKKASRVVFTKAKVNNRGNYTCTATNAFGSTHLTFETFIGGAPNNVSVDVMEETVNKSIELSFSINDISDAPALSVNIKLVGVIETMLDFKDKGLHIPVNHTFRNVVKVDRGVVYAAHYPVVVTASNELGNKTAKREMAFLNGTLPLEVTIEPSSSNVTEGSRYSFECKAHPKNTSNVSIPFTVLINGSSDGPLQKRLVKESSSLLSQKFYFQNVSVADEDVSFACVGSGVYVSELTNLTVFYAPRSMSPVTVPTKTVGDKPFTITVNYTAKPAVTLAKWRRNGVIINNSTRIKSSLKSLQFLSLVPIDNGSYTVTLCNEVGNTTIPFDMIVYYPPILSVNDQLGGFLNQSLVVNVSVNANPTNYTTSWFINGKPLVPGNNIKVKGATIMFSHLTKSNIANYTVEVSNGIGNKSNASFQLVVYDGPNFKEGASNSTILAEHKTGVDFNLTCTIKSTYPKVQELTITPEKGPNWKIHKDPGLESATLVFTKAEAVNNTKKFTCTAKNNVTMSTLTFDNYVGGSPSNVKVKNVTKILTRDSVTLSVEVFDDSHVPATEILFSVKGFSKTNTSKQMPYPPANESSTVIFENVFNATFDELSSSTVYVLKVYAGNKIGIAFVADYNFTIPAKQRHKKSNFGLIAAGVLVPLAVIVLIVIAVIGYFCYRRQKHKQRGFTLLQDGDDGNINNPGSHTDRIIT